MTRAQKHYGLLTTLGLDVSKPAEYLDARATPDCQNVMISRNVIRKKLGTTAMGSSLGERVQKIVELKVGTLTYVVRIGNTKIELYDQAGGTWSDIAGSALTGGASDRIDTAQPLLSGARVLTFTNHKDNIRKYTGTGNTADLGGTPPLAKFMVEYGSYLVLAYITDGGNTYTMRVQWCDTGDIETWSGGNSGSRDLVEDGKDITGISLFGNYLTIHKESSIYIGYLVSSSDIFKFERKNTEVGAVCYDTIKNLPTGEQIFLARDGIHLFNGISAPLIPSPIMDEIRENMNSEQVLKSYAEVVPELDEYWVGVPIGSQTEPETIYKYNFRTRQCYKDVRLLTTAISTYINTDALRWVDMSNTWQADTGRWNDINVLALFPKIIFGESGGITVNREEENDDNGTAISSWWVSKDFECTDKGLLARWLEIEIWAKGNTMKVEYSTDAGSTWTEITSFSTGSSLTLSADYPSDDSPLQGWFDVVSTKIRFRFSNNVSAENMYLKQFVIKYRPREYRGR